MEELVLTKDGKRKRKPGPLRTVEVDLESESKRVLTVVHRQIQQLMIKSYKEPLTRDEINSLSLAYKIIQELKLEQKEQLELLSDEELAKLASKEQE